MESNASSKTRLSKLAVALAGSNNPAAGVGRSSSRRSAGAAAGGGSLVLPATAATEPAEGFWTGQLKAIKALFMSPLMVLLVFVPIGLSAHKFNFNDAVVFGTNFVAIVPLASLLGAATEALSEHTGQLVGGLLNATFGNAVEMIMCCQAVRAGLIEVVQGNMLGSVLSNLLLVLGMAIFASGIVRKEQTFNAHGAAANMTCQLVASISVALPTVFRTVAGTTEEDVLMMSRVCSIFLVLLYGLFLTFMLGTHADLFADEVGDKEAGEEGGEEAEPEPMLSMGMATLMLFLCTLIVAACSENLVDSIEIVSNDYGLPKAFIGVILLPIVGNAAEHATAVTCAHEGMMDLALGVAVGSSSQIALFVVPCAVLFGWAIEQPMSLGFREFDTVCQILSVFLVSQVLQHGNTSWLHGAMLVTVYCIIATQSWFIPEES
eukprot:TRINITY_DN3332_c0_g1_i1.p1 TRINITY_DN3332_c0_g1~~TRINITY_DN3332_c0_g1_i1.p1  ORF type:complete len:434 (+),score=105.05 TRINITY_DN3332_c0_g1_i1:156-1457(+)